MRNKTTRWVALIALFGLAGCSTFTSIHREDDGQYVITGVQAPGRRGFLWVCEYDPATS